MKNKLIILALAALPILVSVPAYAANGCDSDAVHCAYTSSSDATGKYVKLTWPQANNLSGIVFMPLNVSISISNGDLLDLGVKSGKQDWIIEQCSDNTCSNKTQLIDDAFTLTEKFDGTFTASPATQTFDLKSSYGKNCNPTPSKKFF